MSQLLIDRLDEVLSISDEDLEVTPFLSEERIEALLKQIISDPQSCTTIGLQNSNSGACCCNSVAPNNTCSTFGAPIDGCV